MNKLEIKYAGIGTWWAGTKYIKAHSISLINKNYLISNIVIPEFNAEKHIKELINALIELDIEIKNNCTI